MKMNTLGRTDIKVSALCLGTMTFGNQTSKDEAFAQMDRALEAGHQLYGYGRNVSR